MNRLRSRPGMPNDGRSGEEIIRPHALRVNRSSSQVEEEEDEEALAAFSAAVRKSP